MKRGEEQSTGVVVPSDPSTPLEPGSQPPALGIDTLALSLSGGGFRSAGFHLGVLSVLHRAGLLERVRVLSASSGGAIVGAYVLLQSIRKQPYGETHFALSKYLLEAKPISAAIRRATRERTTLTQALARELEETLFDDSRFAVPTMREIFESRASIAEGSFNACELTTGTPFRFSFSRGPAARVGGEESYLPRVIAEHVHLAEVVAASCAFPGAFEPMLMPDDFSWPDAGVLEDARKALGGSARGLVDGGVHDNQGIDGMLLASRRHEEGLSLYLVSDAERSVPPTEPRGGKRVRGAFSLRVWQVSWASWLLILAAIASVVLLWQKVEAERAINDFRWPTDAVAFGGPLAFCLATMLAVLWVRGRVRKTLASVLPGLDRRGWRAVRRMRVVDLVEARRVRVLTLTAVATTTFPRRVRGLVYREAWAARELVGRRVAVQIDSLAEGGASAVESLCAPGETLVSSARRAAALPLSMEIRSAAELDDLLMTGQATAITKLVEFLELNCGTVRSSWPAKLVELDALLHRDWDELIATGRPLRT